ncbi:MAG TPA: hypothetical protein VL309_11770 [Vicinamibacterales bacterium]|nr:hypothetical protein [Vicinamibacterales bacterium]
MRAISQALAAAGAALAVAALAANQPWLDRHFLPSFFVPRAWYVGIEWTVRLALAAGGVALVLGRSRVARWLTRAPSTTLLVIAAAALALVAGDYAIAWMHPRPTEWLSPGEEPRRQQDARLGWVLAPGRTGRRTVSGRTVEYAIDAAGDRVREAGEPVDPARPTIVFAGESVMFGEGLTWDESIPAQAGAMLRTQSANIAVHGYSTDQIYLRLAGELPRFRQPAAVVAIFMTELFGRNLDDDRPHLAPGLVWQPAQRTPPLLALAGLLVPFRRDRTVEQGIRTTREALAAIVQLARHRDAMPLIVVPRFGGDDPVERRLRERILGADIPALIVPLDAGWRLSWDRHPNADGAHAIAAAIAARLRAGQR